MLNNIKSVLRIIIIYTLVIAVVCMPILVVSYFYKLFAYLLGVTLPLWFSFVTFFICFILVLSIRSYWIGRIKILEKKLDCLGGKEKYKWN